MSRKMQIRKTLQTKLVSINIKVFLGAKLLCNSIYPFMCYISDRQLKRDLNNFRSRESFAKDKTYKVNIFRAFMCAAI